MKLNQVIDKRRDVPLALWASHLSRGVLHHRYATSRAKPTATPPAFMLCVGSRVLCNLGFADEVRVQSFCRLPRQLHLTPTAFESPCTFLQNITTLWAVHMRNGLAKG